MEIYVLYHKNCTDGFGAAYSAWKKLGDSAKYIAVNHGEPPPKMKPKSKVYIIDFCYDKNTISQLNSEHDLTILDHHVTSKDAMKFSKESIFNLHKSGASLAWEYFHPEEENQIIKHIEDKDLWLFKLKDTKPIIAALESYPRDFQVWDRFNIDILKIEGSIILKKQAQEVKHICDFAYFTKIDDNFVPVLNTMSYMSDAADLLLKLYPTVPFVGVYYDFMDQNNNLCRKWSLRSRKKEFDVSLLAKKFGGGGHKGAAGYIEIVKRGLK